MTLEYNGYIKLFMGQDYNENSYVLCLLTSVKLRDQDGNCAPEEKAKLKEFTLYKQIKDWHFLTNKLRPLGYYYDISQTKNFCCADLYIPNYQRLILKPNVPHANEKILLNNYLSNGFENLQDLICLQPSSKPLHMESTYPNLSPLNETVDKNLFTYPTHAMYLQEHLESITLLDPLLPKKILVDEQNQSLINSHEKSSFPSNSDLINSITFNKSPLTFETPSPDLSYFSPTGYDNYKIKNTLSNTNSSLNESLNSSSLNEFTNLNIVNDISIKQNNNVDIIENNFINIIITTSDNNNCDHTPLNHTKNSNVQSSNNNSLYNHSTNNLPHKSPVATKFKNASSNVYAPPLVMSSNKVPTFCNKHSHQNASNSDSLPQNNYLSNHTSNHYNYGNNIDSFGNNKQLAKFLRHKPTLFLSHPEATHLSDDESLFSVTPETIAKHIADRMKYKTILDAFCGPGGNLIQFVLNGTKVLAVDNDPNKLMQARHNLDVYLNTPPPAPPKQFTSSSSLESSPFHTIRLKPSTPQGNPNQTTSHVSNVDHNNNHKINNNRTRKSVDECVVFLHEDFERVIEHFRQNTHAPKSSRSSWGGIYGKHNPSTNISSNKDGAYNTGPNRRMSGEYKRQPQYSSSQYNSPYQQNRIQSTYQKSSPNTHYYQSQQTCSNNNNNDNRNQKLLNKLPQSPKSTQSLQDLSFLGSFAQLGFKGLDNVDAIFLDPPWGGLNYERRNAFDLDVLDFNLGAIYKKSCNVTPNIVFKFPRNANICQIASLLKPRSCVEIEQNYLNGFLKFLILYFEDCIDPTLRERAERDIRNAEKITEIG